MEASVNNGLDAANYNGSKQTLHLLLMQNMVCTMYVEKLIIVSDISNIYFYSIDYKRNEFHFITDWLLNIRLTWLDIRIHVGTASFHCYWYKCATLFKHQFSECLCWGWLLPMHQLNTLQTIITGLSFNSILWVNLSTNTKHQKSSNP